VQQAHIVVSSNPGRAAEASIICHQTAKSFTEEITRIPYGPLGHVCNVSNNVCVLIGAFELQ
jgi:hypothetical protein